MSVYFIAEAGVNHNGDRDMAYRLIDAAVAAGADAVKFQTFSAAELASEKAPKAAYQNETTDASESQIDMLRRLELPLEWHYELRDYCTSKGIDFLSTPFDLPSLRFLADALKLKTIKVPSGELTNGPFLLAIARTGCDIILSTGMSTLDEVRTALGVLAFGLLNDVAQPTDDVFDSAFDSKTGQQALLEKVTVLHCTSAYPTPLGDANVSAMSTISKAFGLKTGYSDHTEGEIASITATALGASVIEKHFTLDKNLPGPDHKASLSVEELIALVTKVRAVGLTLGDGVKAPRPSEIDTAIVARKSLTLLCDMAAGQMFTEETLGIKRPGSGASPMTYWDQLGKPATRDYTKDEQL